MPGFRIFTSNQLEKLVEDLAAVLDTPIQSPLAPDVIVVQSRGMARWVSLQLADLSGISMNAAFPFPRAFVDETLRLYFPDMPVAAVFDAGTMAWKIHELLPGLTRKKEFAAVRGYIEEDDGLKLFQLSEKIAHLFDQYMVYRPEMLLAWERSEGEAHWQALLWRVLAGKKPPLHPAAVSELLEERMARLPAAGMLPERVSIFGVSSLPPLYMRVFFALAQHCEVNLFSLNPSQEYYGHDITPGLRARLASRGAAIPDADLREGNPLLTSLGRQARDRRWARAICGAGGRGHARGGAGRHPACAEPGRGGAAREDGRGGSHHPGARVPFAHARGGGAARPAAGVV
jgi:exodeoxyribonuclease V gamma subunit